MTNKFNNKLRKWQKTYIHSTTTADDQLMEINPQNTYIATINKKLLLQRRDLRIYKFTSIVLVLTLIIILVF
jgi:hypothetical protein